MDYIQGNQNPYWINVKQVKHGQGVNASLHPFLKTSSKDRWNSPNEKRYKLHAEHQKTLRIFYPRHRHWLSIPAMIPNGSGANGSGVTRASLGCCSSWDSDNLPSMSWSSTLGDDVGRKVVCMERCQGMSGDDIDLIVRAT